MNPRFAPLFEPITIGPVTAPNRFYQVPHSSGMTNARPEMRAAFRGMKAQGGWGVVCTGASSIHPSSDDLPLAASTIWSEQDVRAHALAVEAIHEHGALAGIELWHGGGFTMNRASRATPLSPSGIGWLPTHVGFMGQMHSKAMDVEDIRNVLGWQKAAARRARNAGFDIVYVYAGMGYLPYQFLLPDYNHRADAYGGPLANRVRFVRQMLDVTREAVGTDCAVALRLSVAELKKRPSEREPTEAHAVIKMLSDAVDLFDVKLDDSATDCIASRHGPEGSHEPIVSFVRACTDKPVVGVGRFTSPDEMVRQIRTGVLDLIGAARPSIADPFLPVKIKEGREDDIRECIGCNMCIASWHEGVPVRCTQNPSVGEEWRSGWHPERPARLQTNETALVIGAGPSGLETALTLARRGCHVTLADANGEPGGRLIFERSLPGLAAWGRVVDYRMGQLQKMANVDLYFDSHLEASDVIEFGADHVVAATGARWLPMAYSTDEFALDRLDGPNVLTPDDIASGADVAGAVTVFDFDSYYMGGVLAECLAERGHEVSYVTPAGMVSNWTILTNELPHIHRRFGALGIEIITRTHITHKGPDEAIVADVFSGQKRLLKCDTLVVVGERRSRTRLFAEIKQHDGPKSVWLTGDAQAPGAIIHATYKGHETAMLIGDRNTADIPMEGSQVQRLEQKELAAVGLL